MSSIDRKRRLFLSYRREDCAMHAGRLADNLRDREIAEVFIDVEEIQLGRPFPEQIEAEIARCDAFLIMIGDDWLTIKDVDGQPRLFNPRDWVHLEVRAALSRDVPVIPVLVEDTMMPRPDQLPHEIRALADRQGTEMRESSWRVDFDRLAAGLPEPLAETDSGSSSAIRKERASIDFVAARSFIEAVPRGRWTTYGDVAAAAGSPQGAQSIGNWLSRHGEEIPNVWRVLNTKGQVSPGWAPESPDLPPTRDAVLALLEVEGVAMISEGADPGQRWQVEDAADDGVALAMTTDERSPSRSQGNDDVLIVAGRRAYPDYFIGDAYICQPGRSFRSGIERLGFYFSFEIKREIPRILHRRDNVEFTPRSVSLLAAGTELFDRELATLVAKALDPRAGWSGERGLGEQYQVFLLSAADHPETLVMSSPLRHNGKNAWVQSQRYVSSEALTHADSTADL